MNAPNGLMRVIHPPICEQCNDSDGNLAEIKIMLTDLDGIILDSLVLCIPCATQAHVSRKGNSFTFVDSE